MTVTQGVDFFLHENKNKNGNQNNILSGFFSISFTKQQQQNVTTTLEKLEENTPILTNFANKTFPYLSENTNTIGSRYKMLFGFNQHTMNEFDDISINASADPKDVHQLLQELHELLQTTDKIAHEPYIINNINHTT